MSAQLLDSILKDSFDFDVATFTKDKESFEENKNVEEEQDQVQKEESSKAEVFDFPLFSNASTNQKVVINEDQDKELYREAIPSKRIRAESEEPQEVLDKRRAQIESIVVDYQDVLKQSKVPWNWNKRPSAHSVRKLESNQNMDELPTIGSLETPDIQHSLKKTEEEESSPSRLEYQQNFLQSKSKKLQLHKKTSSFTMNSLPIKNKSSSSVKLESS